MKILSKLLKQKFKIEFSEIKNVVMDSRKVEEGSLFFAINNGNNFVDKALADGAELIIADNYLEVNPKVIKVKDTIKTMQEIAKNYRENLDIKIIGITGSNGKTTTKDLIYSVLREKYKCKKTEGNYNNHIGLPYTLLQAEDDDQVMILEMGMSSFGEIDRLGFISAPDYGIITNIGDSHLEFLKNRENVCKAKTELLKYITPEKTILFGDDFYLKNIPGIKVGFENNNDFQILDLKDDETGVKFIIDSHEYSLSLNGRHNATNAAMAVVIGKEFGLLPEQIENGLKNLSLSKMRFEKVEIGNTLYINDAYNASPVSMIFSIETLANLYQEKFRIVALGDMLELGEQEIEYHKEVIKKAASSAVDMVCLYGYRMQKAFEEIALDPTIEGEILTKITWYEDKEDIKKDIQEIPVEKVVLLKGSRGMRMEEIIEK